MNIQIKQMEISDYESVIKLWKNIEGIGLSDADSKDGIEKFLIRNPGLSFIAKSNGDTVGAALCGHDGRRGYLHHLAVAPEYRNRRIGSELVEKCLSGLKVRGIMKCNIFVFDANVDGQEFWSNIGWIKRGDLLVMQKPVICETRAWML
jgi:N-acetylglutamate synthase